MRANDLGAFGFSNDEAWVALSTRVEGTAQYWLAIVMTPIGWAAVVKGLSLVHVSEAALRLVPFAFGVATVALAYRAGRRFAGHRLGGVLAMAAAAFDPLAIGYAKVLKQYTAEAFFCLLALDRAAVFARRRTPRALLVVAAVLALGVPFSNAQLVVAPAVFGALLLDALVRRDARAARTVLAAGAAVGAWACGYCLLLVRPRLPSATDPYWSTQQYLPFAWSALEAGWTRLAWSLRPALGATTTIVALAALATGCLVRRQRVVAVALVLLLLEIAGLSLLGVVPVSQPRVLLFLTTSLAAFAAAAVGGLVARAWRRPLLGVAATIALALLAVDFARAHPWRRSIRPLFVEDAGPLVRLMEQQRRPGDVVLLHLKTIFIHAYYQRAVPRLVPARDVSTGFLPVRAPSTRLVKESTVAAEIAAARVAHRRAWLVASRLRREEELRLRRKIRGGGAAVVREERRPGAFLLLLDLRPPVAPPA
ncbi:MAG TPA: glycosyltransferase family 39 protein [Candidatus Limnocylindria bacterium]|nr:glycosyltransferase family 39 protein [Candidatus Limnocylindria bacterium]